MDLISVLGLGKLGLPLAAAAASRGYRVIAYDRDPRVVASLRARRWPAEPGLGALLDRHAARIELTSDIGRVTAASLSFLVVPTPSKRDGSFSTRALEQALESLGGALRGARARHVAAVVSTVLPGDMSRLAGVLETSSGRTIGRALGLVYNPVFIALGDVLRGLCAPDLVLIGESDKRSGAVVEALHRRLTGTGPMVHRMNFVNAELTKIALNSYVTMKISFGNALARLCERLPGGHCDVVARAIGSDRRIGPHVLRGAVGYGGPCFPRDNRAFSAVARRVGLRARLAEATDRANAAEVDRLSEIVLARVARKGRVAILGAAYKPDTHVVEASQAIALAQRLVDDGRKVTLCDPAALEGARRELGETVSYEPAIGPWLRDVDGVVLFTPWPAFKRLAARDLRRVGDGRQVVIDCWRALDGRRFPAHIEYVPLGVSGAA